MINYNEYFDKWQGMSFNSSAEEYLHENERVIINRINDIEIKSIWGSLVNPNIENKQKLLSIGNILYDFLDNTDIHPRIHSGIALTIRHQCFANKANRFDDLFIRYSKVPPSKSLSVPLCRGVDQSYANALSSHFTIDKLNSYTELLDDESLGESRALLILGFKRYINEKPVRALLFRYSQMPLYKHITEKLLKYKVKPAKPLNKHNFGNG